MASKQRTLFAYVPDDGDAARPQQGQGWAILAERARQGAGQGAGRVLLLAVGVRRRRPTPSSSRSTRAPARARKSSASRTATSTATWSATTTASRASPTPSTTDGDADACRTARRRPRVDAAAEVDRRLRDRRRHDRRRQQHAVRARLPTRASPTQLYKIDLAAGTRTKLVGRDDVGRRHDHDRRPQRRAVRRDLRRRQARRCSTSTRPRNGRSCMPALMKSVPGPDGLLPRLHPRRQQGAVLDVQRSRAGQLLRARPRQWQQDRCRSATRMPWIEPASRWRRSKPIEFNTRDGAKLYGFYTAPSAAPGPHPLVVMPHGGPFGPSDNWGFDDDVQFLASRGYGVLQVNYRGSGGRGDEFIEPGYKQWGADDPGRHHRRREVRDRRRSSPTRTASACTAPASAATRR